MSFTWDPIKCKVITSDKKEITTNSNYEFFYNDVTYIVFKGTMFTRNYNTVYDYTDDLHYVPCFIEKVKAIDWIETFVNLSHGICELSTIKKNQTFAETINKIREKLRIKSQEYAQISSESIEASNQIYNMLENMVDKLDEESKVNGLKNSDTISFLIDSEKDSLSDILFKTNNLIAKYTTFHDDCINYITLNYSGYFIFRMLQLLLIEASITPSDLFCDKNGIFVHTFVAALKDILVDKLTYELFIKQRSQCAKNLLKGYSKYNSVLSTITKKEDFIKLPRDLIEKVKNEKISMFPFLFILNFPPEQRIMLVYETIVKSVDDLKNSQTITSLNFSLPKAENLFSDVLIPLKENTKNGFYQTETITSIFMKFLVPNQYDVMDIN